MAAIPAEHLATTWQDNNKEYKPGRGAPLLGKAVPEAALKAALKAAGTQQTHIWSAAGRANCPDLRAALANLDTIGSSLSGEDVSTSQTKKHEPHAGRIDYLDKLFHDTKLDFVGLNETKWKRQTDWVTQDNFTFLLPIVPKEIIGEGVGLAIKNKLLPSLLTVHPYSSRILRTHFKGK